MLQVASGSDRNIWAHELGWLIISMNEIDWLISTAYSTLFGGVWDEKWLAKTAAERRDILLGEMSKAPKSPALERLVRLIDRAVRLWRREITLLTGNWEWSALQ